MGEWKFYAIISFNKIESILEVWYIIFHKKIFLLGLLTDWEMIINEETKYEHEDEEIHYMTVQQLE